MQMSFNEIIVFWGNDLVRWPRSAVDTLSIPESSRTFLAEVGLPCPKDRLFIYSFDCGQPLVRNAENSRLVRVAHKPRPIFIDESKSGLVLMPTTGDDPQRFVNSSIEQFGAFLVLQETMLRDVTRLNDELTSGRMIVTAIEEAMRNTDSEALADEKNYWSVVIEDAWYPLLNDEELKALTKKYSGR